MALSLDQALSKAKSHIKKRELTEAKKIYQDILQEYPLNNEAQREMAALSNTQSQKEVQELPQEIITQLIILYNQGQSALLLDQAQSLISRYPHVLIIWNIMGLANKSLKRLKEATEAFMRVTELNPNYADGFNNLGATLQQQGRLDEAIEAFKRVIELNPEHADGFNNMGITLHQQGKLEKALATFNKALLLRPDFVEIYFNMGNIFKDQGKLEEAIETYKVALTIRHDYAEVHYNMGIILQDQRKLDNAIEAYRKAILSKPDFADAYMNMGNTLKERGKLNEAIEAYSNTILIKPDYAEAYNNIGVAHTALEKLDEGIDAYRKAILLKPDYANAYNGMGIALAAQDKLEQAIEAYRKAISIKTDHAEAYYNMGNALKKQDKLNKAIEAFRAALKIKPDYADAYNSLGVVFKEQDRLEQAIEAYRKAISIKTDHAEAWINGAEALEKWNKLERLNLWLESAFTEFQIVPADIEFLQSKLLWRNKKVKKATTALLKINFEEISKIRKLDYLNLKAKCLHASKDFYGAYNCFFDMNLLAKASEDYSHSNPNDYFQSLTNDLSKLRSMSVPILETNSNEKNDLNPVFLVGFPRSGTTLLDTILRSHSKIEIIEEKSAVTDVETVIQRNGYYDVINTKLPPELIANAREVYKAEFTKHIKGINSTNVYIDKLPLNLLQAPLIQQLYPGAKFILALRHPMDTVLSCWMQNFQLNQAMANMVELPRIVEFYCVAMEIFKICKDTYNLNVHEIKYEDLLEDFTGEASAILNFLDLNWEDELENYRDTAINRGRIHTPSYSQVVQPIYKDAKYRWVNYEVYLNKYFEQLEPWIANFGYDKN